MIALLIFVILIVILIYVIFHLHTCKEGFWSQDTLDNFLKYSKTAFPKTTFNTDILQQQASEQEVDGLLKNGYWQWSNETKNNYKNAISNNPIIKINPEESLKEAMKIYNENAIKQMLYWNTKEGKFVLYGLISKNRDIIRCNNGKLNKTIFKGYNYFNGYSNSTTSAVNLPNDIPGFKFTNGVCNPCAALDDDYSCKFQLNI